MLALWLLLLLELNLLWIRRPMGDVAEWGIHELDYRADDEVSAVQIYPQIASLRVVDAELHGEHIIQLIKELVLLEVIEKILKVAELVEKSRVEQLQDLVVASLPVFESVED